MNLGLAIKRCRNQLGLTQPVLAKRAGLSVSYLSMLEKSKRDPSIKMIERIASALGIPTSILVLFAADPAELAPIDQAIAEKISFLTLNLLRENATTPMLF